VLDRKRLEADAPGAKRTTRRHYLSPLDQIAVDDRPNDVARVHAAGSAVAKPPA
jgi:hypothetical protein